MSEQTATKLPEAAMPGEAVARSRTIVRLRHRLLAAILLPAAYGLTLATYGACIFTYNPSTKGGTLHGWITNALGSVRRVQRTT